MATLYFLAIFPPPVPGAVFTCHNLVCPMTLSLEKPIFITSCTTWLFQREGNGGSLIFTPTQLVWWEGNGNLKAAKGWLS